MLSVGAARAIALGAVAGTAVACFDPGTYAGGGRLETLPNAEGGASLVAVEGGPSSPPGPDVTAPDASPPGTSDAGVFDGAESVDATGPTEPNDAARAGDAAGAGEHG